MTKLLLDNEDYEKITGRSFYDDYIKPVMEKRQQKKIENSKKIPIPNHFKWLVWERDNFTCKHCGSRKNLSVDHIIPESKGGILTMENAQTLCRSCNSRKGAK